MGISQGGASTSALGLLQREVHLRTLLLSEVPHRKAILTHVVPSHLDTVAKVANSRPHPRFHPPSRTFHLRSPSMYDSRTPLQLSVVGDQLFAKGISDLAPCKSHPERKNWCPLLPFSPFPLVGNVVMCFSNTGGHRRATSQQELWSSILSRGQIAHPDLYVRNLHFV